MTPPRSRYYVCLNQVSYVIACEHATLHPGGTILADPGRVRLEQRYRHVDTKWLVRRTLVACLLRSLVRRPVLLYLPHRRTGRLVLALAALAVEVHLIDDGLDTLRDVPRNIELDSFGVAVQLLTFADYLVAGAWTRRVTLVRVCALSVLLDDERPPLETAGFDTVVVESPGVGAGVEAAAGRTLYVAHPSRHKKASPPPGTTVTNARFCSLEKALVAFEGTIVVGETMVLVVLLFAARSPEARLQVHLTGTQHANLRSLHDRLSGRGVDLRLVP